MVTSIHTHTTFISSAVSLIFFYILIVRFVVIYSILIERSGLVAFLQADKYFYRFFSYLNISTAVFTGVLDNFGRFQISNNKTPHK